MVGGLSSRQTVWVGSFVGLFGAYLLSRGALGAGVVLCGIGALMLARRVFSS
ncbi:MAG TPA: hypothetical protein VG937_37275 [Polyangiaceae bacterium]|jgi:hypothetical protein|nr:hypothetical protein [Polyangiaceae bacterium]